MYAMRYKQIVRDIKKYWGIKNDRDNINKLKKNKNKNKNLESQNKRQSNNCKRQPVTTSCNDEKKHKAMQTCEQKKERLNKKKGQKKRPNVLKTISQILYRIEHVSHWSISLSDHYYFFFIGNFVWEQTCPKW